MNPGYDTPVKTAVGGIRSELISSYEIPRIFYASTKGLSAVKQLGELGCLIWYSHNICHTGRKKRTPMDVDKMVQIWHKAVVGLAIAHDKDEADRYEASIEECLVPLLSCPIKQLREFTPKLLASLKADKAVPFLVWRSYEVWIETILDKAVDEEVKELKTALAKEIADIVEEDVKEQLPEAIVRALQWRSGEHLEEVKQVITKEKAKGKKVRLRGRESCLFIEAGGTEKEPEVCIQV